MNYKKYPRLEKASNGYYYAFYVDSNGFRQRKSLKERNELRAQAKFVKLLREVDRGTLGFGPTPRALPFPEAAKRYLDEGTGRLQPSSKERHRIAIDKHLTPYFKKASLKAIGPQTVLTYIAGRQRAEAAPNTIHKEIAALSAIFAFHVEIEELTYNPVLSVRKPKPEIKRPNYAPTFAEVMKILNHISPYSRRFFLALWSTGARFSEVERANVGDVDLETKTIRFRRKGGRYQVVGLNEVAVAAIREELECRGFPEASAPLFTNRLKRRIGKIHEALEKACKNAGVPYVTHHSLRHSFARQLRKQRYSLQEIGKLLGHKAGSSMTIMYADMADDEVVELGQGVPLALENVQKK